jgi:ABC-2 type transport system ATP-binding protein
MIECLELTKDFADFRAVDRVSLKIARGEVLALLGPNGAGKTTTVRMMTSILQPTSGTAVIAGYDVTQQPEKVRAHVGVLTEQHGLYERMKGLEYLDFFGRVYHLACPGRELAGKGTCRTRRPTANTVQSFPPGAHHPRDAPDNRVKCYASLAGR